MSTGDCSLASGYLEVLIGKSQALVFYVTCICEGIDLDLVHSPETASLGHQEPRV